MGVALLPVARIGCRMKLKSKGIGVQKISLFTVLFSLTGLLLISHNICVDLASLQDTNTLQEGIRIAAIIACCLLATSIGESLPDIDEDILRDAWSQAEESLHLELSTIDNKYTERQGSSYGLKSPKTPRDETLQVWRQAEVFARAVDRVSETQNLTRSVSERLMERAAPRTGLDPNVLCRNRRFSCNPSFKYRRTDGACNNLGNTDWGMAVSRLARLIDPVYGDGFNTFRRSVRGGDLPLARFVSTMCIPDIDRADTRWTHMLMFFGQFMNHDLTSTPHRTDLDQCCGQHANNADCLPIRIPNSDPQFGPLRIGCMEFARSHRACGSGARQQMNQNTAFIDASQMYGSIDSEMNNLRTFTGGRLKFSTSRTAGMLPPQNASDQTCVKSQGVAGDCFIAGDNRANENPGLSSMHVIFLREHNRIADGLAQIRRRDDETLFQETRRIMIAQLQNIVYNEFVADIVGPATVREFALGLPGPNTFTDYDNTINPNTINSFSTAAYRFGHSVIQGRMNMQGFASINLPDHFNNPSTIHQGGLEPLLSGAAGQASQRMDNYVTEAVTRQLFREGNNQFGMDLAALNIQRGRDHGLPSYNAFRRLCGLQPARSAADLRNFFVDPDAVSFFMDAYNQQVDDIDLWPAGIAEKPKEGAIVGPTFACIMATQFNRLKWGDRFFFTHRNQAGSFTNAQLTNIRARTLASVICDTSNVDSMQLNAFRQANNQNANTNCRNHPKLDLSLF